MEYRFAPLLCNGISVKVCFEIDEPGSEKRGVILRDPEKKPEVRSGFLQQELKALEKLDPAVRKRILDRIPKTTVQTIYQVKDNTWLPLEFDIQLSENIMAELDEEAFVKLNLTVNKSLIASSFFGPFIRSALYLFKISPQTLLKIAPQIWNSCYRNCGKISVVEKELYRIHIVLEDLPLEFVESKPNLIAISAFIRALDDFTGAKHTKVLIEQQSKLTRSVVFNVSWDASN